MENLIKELFKLSIKNGKLNYSISEIKSSWIGNKPVSYDTISKTEQKLNISLPKDYKKLISITNGFKTSNDAIEPNFFRIQEIDYLRNKDPFVIECYEDTHKKELTRSILIGGEAETQFLLIPPDKQVSHWRYWKFAHWIPGEREFSSIIDYLNNVISYLRN